MPFWELLIIAVAVSTDAFALCICKGLTVKKLSWKHIFIAAAWTGGAQTIMPFIGYFVGNAVHVFVTDIEPWLTFIIFTLVGIHMIIESKTEHPVGVAFTPKIMFPLAFVDSIDSMAVGLSFALEDADILPIAFIIGAITILFATLGITLGHRFGKRLGDKAERIAGIVIIIMGIIVLLQDLNVIK